MRASATIAIPTFNDDASVFGEVLDGTIAAAADTPIIVVDMSTTDSVKTACSARADRVRHHPFPDSGGVSSSRNLCMELAPSRYVVFLDSDAFPEPRWLEALLSALERPRVAVAGSRVLPRWERRPPRLMTTVTASDWLSLFDLGPHEREVPRIMGTSFAVDRERLPGAPFDESVGRRPGSPMAMEENLLCRQVRESGWRVVYEPGSVVRHRIPPNRARWGAMLRRAHTAGREQRMRGRWEPIPQRRLGPRDRLFQAIVAAPFLAGVLRPPPADRPGVEPLATGAWGDGAAPPSSLAPAPQETAVGGGLPVSGDD